MLNILMKIRRTMLYWGDLIAAQSRTIVMITPLVALVLVSILPVASGQRLGNACGKDETNRYLAMVDCTTYVRCRNGETVVERCPVMTYFNPNTLQCDLQSYQQCAEASDPNRLRLLRQAYNVKHVPQAENVDQFHMEKTQKTVQANQFQGGAKKMVCYYTNWAQYRPGFAKFTPKDIDPSLCTHFHYAFAKLHSNNTLAPYEWNDESTPWMEGMYVKFTNLKQQYPNLKMMLSLGGWNLASGPFTRMVVSKQTRKIFIDSAIVFLRKWNFDGLGIDWEYPGSRGSPAGDKEKFTLLVQETMAVFEDESRSTNRPRLLLSAAVSAGKNTIDQAYEVPKVASAIDYFVLMTYDFFGAWNPYTGLVSPLYPPKGARGIDAIFNVQYATNYWVSKGCPSDKLVVGVISYGRSFTLTNTSDTGLKAPARGAGTKGTYTREAGFLSYYEVCRMIQRGAKIVHLDVEKVPYLVLGDQWVSYEDQASIKIKSKYILDGGFAGAAIWSVPLDDFKGNVCGEGPYPLMSIVSKAMKNGIN